MARVAAEASASALQYGPTDGFHALKSCIVEVMGEEGMTVSEDELLVTAGGQQVIDLVCKTLIDPGDVIIAEGPTYPGAVPTFGAYEADVVQIELDDDGMRVDLLEQALDQLAREGRTPKFVYTVPTFQDPAGVTMSLERRRRLVRMASERELLVLEDNPYGLLRYEGDPLPTLYALDGGEYVTYLGTFSKILAPGLRLGWTAAPRPVLEKLALAKQGADLCPSSFGPYFVIEYFARRDWRDLIGSRRAHYPHRRDAMLEAMAEHFPREAQWTSPAGGLFIWATLPDYIDTTDLLALALREHVAFVPGRAAYLDGRGSAAMRLSFSAADEEDLRDGIARIGKVVNDQVRLYPTLTRTGHGTVRERSAPESEGEVSERARILPLSLAQDESRRRPGRRTVFGAPGLVAIRGARARRARTAWTRGHRDRRRPDLVDRLADRRPDVAFIALHGRDGEDGSVQEILELMGVAYTASGASACMRCMDKVLTKHALRDAGLPTPDFYSFSQTAFQSLGAGLALPTIEERLDFPVVVKPAAQGSALGIRFAATAADVPAAIVAAFSYDTKVLLERRVAGRDLPISITRWRQRA